MRSSLAALTVSLSSPITRERKRTYAPPALEKGLDVLELFASAPRGLTATEAARRLNCTVSQIFRPLLCLQGRDYLSRSRDKEYYLGPQLFRVSQEHPRITRFVTKALPVMQRVAHQLGQACNLAVLDGGHVVIVAHVDSPRSPCFCAKPGSESGLLNTAAGLVVLAHQSEQARRYALEAWARETNGNAPEDLSVRLAKTFRRGHEIRASLKFRGLVSISCPLFGAHHEAVAALTVLYVKRIDSERGIPDVIESLRKASREVSEALERNFVSIAIRRNGRRNLAAGGIEGQKFVLKVKAGAKYQFDFAAG